MNLQPIIQPLTFIDASTFTAHFIVKYRQQMTNGVLPLRDLGEDGVEVEDLAVLKEWKSARAMLRQIRNGAADSFGGVIPELGKVWVESLPPETCSPWTREEGDYADAHVRVRLSLVPGMDCYTCVGANRAILAPGMITRVEHRLLSCEMNLGQNARTHLVIDVRVPDEEPAE